MTNLLRKLLVVPHITGGWALLCNLAAIAFPTLVRAAVDHAVSGIAFVPYFPCVLLAAIFLGWRHAAIVAVASAAIVDALFIGPPTALLGGPTDIFGVSVFLLASALTIGFVHAARSAIMELNRPRVDDSQFRGIVFSSEAGHAWASWYDRGTPVHLGPQDEVAAMMQDFLAQLDLGKRLAG